MSRPLLFAHGWGYDSSVWDAVLRCLPGRSVFRTEAGFLGGTPNWPTVPDGTLLVGHSAGVLALLRRRPPGCAGLVAINGFTRFRADDRFPGVADRLLGRMQQGLAQKPDEVVRAFRRTCGDASAPGAVDADALAEGLGLLRTADERESVRAGLPVLALAARDDPVVLPAQTEACFAETNLRWSDSGGHLLPLSRPDWCAAMIESVAW